MLEPKTKLHLYRSPPRVCIVHAHVKEMGLFALQLKPHNAIHILSNPSARYLTSHHRCMSWCSMGHFNQNWCCIILPYYILLYLTISHYISLYLTVSHYISLYLTVSHYISLYLTISYYKYISLTTFLPQSGWKENIQEAPSFGKQWKTHAMMVCLDVPPSLTCSFWNCSLASLSLVMLAAVQIVSVLIVLEGRIGPISQKNCDCLQPQKPSKTNWFITNFPSRDNHFGGTNPNWAHATWSHMHSLVGQGSFR